MSVVEIFEPLEPRRISRWTPEDDDQLRLLWDKHRDNIAIAGEMGISVEAVRHRRSVLRLLIRQTKVGGGHSTWTPEQDAELIKYRQAMWSATLIAEKLGVTRNAVLGRVHRLGLPKLSTGAPEKKIKRPKQPPHRYARSKPKLVFVGPLDDTPDLETPLEQRKTLIELEACHCRWPVGDPQQADFFFCGAPPVIGPYCGKHHLRARA